MNVGLADAYLANALLDLGRVNRSGTGSQALARRPSRRVGVRYRDTSRLDHLVIRGGLNPASARSRAVHSKRLLAGFRNVNCTATT